MTKNNGVGLLSTVQTTPHCVSSLVRLTSHRKRTQQAASKWQATPRSDFAINQEPINHCNVTPLFLLMKMFKFRATKKAGIS